MVFESPEYRFWVILGSFWGNLGGPGAVLGASWTFWERLDGVLGRLGMFPERPTIFGCV